MPRGEGGVNISLLTENSSLKQKQFMHINYLNQKIDSTNCQLEKMYLNKGHDFVDDNNIKFGHLNRGDLHINPIGQKRLAMNFITQIKSSG